MMTCTNNKITATENDKHSFGHHVNGIEPTHGLRHRLSTSYLYWGVVKSSKVLLLAQRAYTQRKKISYIYKTI